MLYSPICLTVWGFPILGFFFLYMQLALYQWKSSLGAPYSGKTTWNHHQLSLWKVDHAVAASSLCIFYQVEEWTGWRMKKKCWLVFITMLLLPPTRSHRKTDCYQNLSQPGLDTVLCQQIRLVRRHMRSVNQDRLHQSIPAKLPWSGSLNLFAPYWASLLVRDTPVPFSPRFHAPGPAHATCRSRGPCSSTCTTSSFFWFFYPPKLKGTVPL